MYAVLCPADAARRKKLSPEMLTQPSAQVASDPLVALEVASGWSPVVLGSASYQAGWFPQRVAEEAAPVDQICQVLAAQVDE